MKIILIHGIGDNNSGWSNQIRAAQLLGVSKDSIVEFTYEDLMENKGFNKALVMATRLVASYYATPVAGYAANTVQEYLDDLLMYFIVPGVRRKIMHRLAKTLKEHPNAIVIGFSLGSIVAYETIKNFPDPKNKPILITLGSPLGSLSLKALVRQFLKIPDRSRPVVKHWFNIYSKYDVLSGKITGLHCNPRHQFRVKSLHKMSTYLRYTRRLLPHLF